MQIMNKKARTKALETLDKNVSDYFKREGLFDRDTDDSYTPEERLALYRLAAKTIEGEAPHVGTDQGE